MNWLIDPLEPAFMRMGFLAVFFVGVTCATIGVYVVLRRMAFIGDALAHTVLPGIVIAYLYGWNLFWGALVAGLITAMGIGWLSRRQELREDTAIGVMFTGMFALGIVMMSSTRSFRDFHSILFGNILGITATNLVLLILVAVLVLGVLLVLFKEMELVSYDPNFAAVIGLKTERLRYILMILLAFTVVSGIQAVGVVLTSALLITPAAAASLLTDRLPKMMLLSSLFAVLGGVIGLYLSYYFAVSSGASIVLACTVIFGFAYAYRSLSRTRSASRATP
jgi:ABC-type Mn2+/Zn2+ transport system permease subunit